MSAADSIGRGAGVWVVAKKAPITAACARATQSKAGTIRERGMQKEVAGPMPVAAES